MERSVGVMEGSVLRRTVAATAEVRGYPGGVLPVTPVTRRINIGFFAWCTREQTRDKPVPRHASRRPSVRSKLRGGVMEYWCDGRRKKHFTFTYFDWV